MLISTYDMVSKPMARIMTIGHHGKIQINLVKPQLKHRAREPLTLTNYTNLNLGIYFIIFGVLQSFVTHRRQQDDDCNFSESQYQHARDTYVYS
jgi:hypothetical protein